MKIKTMVMAGLATIGFGVAAVATPVYAEPNANGITCPDGSTNSAKAKTLAECNLTGENDLMPTIANIINVVIGVLGLVTVAMIILGGIQYVTSVGDSQKVKKAKDTILYGVIGLVIAVLAYAIVNFVTSSLTKDSETPGGGGGDTTTVEQH